MIHVLAEWMRRLVQACTAFDSIGQFDTWLFAWTQSYDFSPHCPRLWFSILRAVSEQNKQHKLMINRAAFAWPECCERSYMIACVNNKSEMKRERPGRRFYYCMCGIARILWKSFNLNSAFAQPTVMKRNRRHRMYWQCQCDQLRVSRSARSWLWGGKSTTDVWAEIILAKIEDMRARVCLNRF